VDHAGSADAAARELMIGAARHIDVIATRLAALGVPRLALSGGLATCIEPWLAPTTQELLVKPEGDALNGALQLALLEAEALAQPVGQRG
jgi:glucosamine kinase